jgi:hypothetical protein
VKVTVRRLWSYGQRIIKREWPGLLKTTGYLCIIESKGDLLNRTYRSAHLYGEEGLRKNEQGKLEGEILPELIDAAVISLRGRKMIITGLETVKHGDAHMTFAQTWMVDIEKDVQAS